MKCGYCTKEDENRVKVSNSQIEKNPLLPYLENKYLCENCYNTFLHPQNRRKNFIYTKRRGLEEIDKENLFNTIIDYKEEPFLIRTKMIGQKKEYMWTFPYVDEGFYCFCSENIGCFVSEDINKTIKIFERVIELKNKYSKKFLLELSPTKADYLYLSEISNEDYNYIQNMKNDKRYIYAVTVL